MTPQYQELLLHEEFIAAIERIRAGESAKRSKWLEILNSPAVVAALTAVITVGLGGIVGSIIVSKYQEKQKQNAVAQEQFQTFLQKQRDVVDHAVDLIGDGEFDSAGLMELTQRRYNVRNAEGKFPPELQKSRSEILAAHEAFRRQWGTGKLKTAVLLDYYFLARPAVTGSWRQVAESLDSLDDCAWGQYQNSNQHGPTDTPSDQLCLDQRKKLNEVLAQFSQSLDDARSYAWQRFSIPVSTN